MAHEESETLRNIEGKEGPIQEVSISDLIKNVASASTAAASRRLFFFEVPFTDHGLALFM
ncbi:hypothetical protein CK224_29060 [Mesorhizobium sp. WSM3862]|nr:hypothetical protein CK224_29060 [Mesorhizobium sp. WSM3862]